MCSYIKHSTISKGCKVEETRNALNYYEGKVTTANGLEVIRVSYACSIK